MQTNKATITINPLWTGLFYSPSKADVYILETEDLDKDKAKSFIQDGESFWRGFSDSITAHFSDPIEVVRSNGIGFRQSMVGISIHTNNQAEKEQMFDLIEAFINGWIGARENQQ